MYRKSRVESRPTSMLPKPRQTASMERRSVEARRASARASSAEPVRPGAPRLSRDTSASKIPLNRRSKSAQQGANERYGPHHSTVTPVRNTAYSRATTTPVRTPSQDGRGHSWQASVERALAFVTYKDQRPLSDISWQRAENARVQAALAARSDDGGGLALIRPLTITRFVDICGGLLSAACGAKLTNENYVAKLPNLAKRLLYPGAVSKSWLKTVNTLHAFPQALAIIAYLLDIVEHIERSISDEWVYRDRDSLSCLRRDYLAQCWLQFESPDCDFTATDQEYINELRTLMGDDELKIKQLTAANAELESALNDESEQAGRSEEERARSRRDALQAASRALKIEGRALKGQAEDVSAKAKDAAVQIKTMDSDIASHMAEIEQLKAELRSQNMSVSERAQLVADAQYAARVADSKRSLGDQLASMVQSKEAEITEWQQRALDSCLQYKRALIHLAPRHPHLAELACDEKELMEESCAETLLRGVESLRALLTQAKEQRLEHERALHCQHRLVAAALEEAQATVSELQSAVERESSALETETAREAAEASEWARSRDALHEQLRALSAPHDQRLARAQHDLEHWERQDVLWRSKLSEMREYTNGLKATLQEQLENHKRATADQVRKYIDALNAAADAMSQDE